MRKNLIKINRKLIIIALILGCVGLTGCVSQQSKHENLQQTAMSEAQAQKKQQVTYKLYQNPRFEFSIKYPDMLLPKVLSDNGDGIILRASDGSVELTASGINNVLNETAASAYEKVANEHSNASYKKQEGNWFVVSWVDGDKIAYYKSVVGSGSINTFIIKYPLNKKEFYDSVVSNINSSFKTPGINNSH